MAYYIDPIAKEECVCLSFEGDIPPEELAAVGYETRGLLSARRWTRVLTDITHLDTRPTALQLIDFVQGLAGNLPAGSRLALVVVPDQTRETRLLQKVSRKGCLMVASFLDPDRAAVWLKRAKATATVLGVPN